MSKMRPSGGYRTTCSFQTATIIYDATYLFCGKFLDARSRTVDQMVQAARSGRQNIAEGSRAAATSSQTELRLLNVARSSLEELLSEKTRSARSVRSISPHSCLSEVRQTHGPPHCEDRPERRPAVLGLFRLPRLHRRLETLTTHHPRARVVGAFTHAIGSPPARTPSPQIPLSGCGIS